MVPGLDTGRGRARISLGHPHQVHHLTSLLIFLSFCLSPSLLRLLIASRFFSASIGDHQVGSDISTRRCQDLPYPFLILALLFLAPALGVGKVEERALKPSSRLEFASRQRAFLTIHILLRDGVIAIITASTWGCHLTGTGTRSSLVERRRASSDCPERDNWTHPIQQMQPL